MSALFHSALLSTVPLALSAVPSLHVIFSFSEKMNEPEGLGLGIKRKGSGNLRQDGRMNGLEIIIK